MGHEFGDPETEREREERGDEVVITIRELQVCRRCDAEQVTSESTEVRPVRPAPDSVTEDSDAEPDDPAEVDIEDAAVDAGTGPPEDTPDPDVEDDAVILEDDDVSTPDRAPGQWPDADDTRVGNHDADHQPTQADTPDDPETGDAEDGGELLEEDPSDVDHDDGSEVPGTSEQSEDSQSGTEQTEWPDPGRGDDEGFDATTPDTSEDEGEEEYVEAADDPPTSGIVSPAEEPVTVEEADDVFVCPSCDYREPVAGSSLRGGDICPSCKKGYLTERSS